MKWKQVMETVTFKRYLWSSSWAISSYLHLSSGSQLSETPPVWSCVLFKLQLRLMLRWWQCHQVNALWEKHLRDLRDWFHVKVQSKRGGMSGEIAVLRKHNCSSSSASGLNCIFPILGCIKQWKPGIAKYPSQQWCRTVDLSMSFCLVAVSRFLHFPSAVSRHASFPTESQPGDYTEIQLKAIMIEHIIE